MRRKPQPPLQRIVARRPDKYAVEERLECGHLYVSYQEAAAEAKAKRRRCHECLRPPKKPVAWAVESGTAESFAWSIQRKAKVVL